jgi:glycosyltransferase involved in cell wall biosynthesis
MSKSALVVIPATGKKQLRQAVQSVLNQTHKNITCLVIVDGPEFQESVKQQIGDLSGIKYLNLPWNIGANNWYGHRSYYLSGPLLEQDYWFALDQDNWYEPEHVETMIDTCEESSFHWAYSLRNIYTADDVFICQDNCESLGKYPVFLSDNSYLVDTSAYCIKKEVFVRIANAWYNQWGADRYFYSVISQYFPEFGCSTKYSLNYRLDGNPGSVTAEFFLQGNQITKQKYPQGYPWLKGENNAIT